MAGRGDLEGAEENGDDVARGLRCGARMNVVFLSPHFPPNWFQFVRAAAAMPARQCSASRDAPYDELRPELRERARPSTTASTTSPTTTSWCARWAASSIATAGSTGSTRSTSTGSRPRRVCAPTSTSRASATERHRRHQAQVADEGAFRSGAGLGRGAGPGRRTDGRVRQAFVAEVGYPVVAKPDVGVGAARTYKLDDDVDLERYLRRQAGDRLHRRGVRPRRRS